MATSPLRDLATGQRGSNSPIFVYDNGPWPLTRAKPPAVKNPSATTIIGAPLAANHMRGDLIVPTSAADDARALTLDAGSRIGKVDLIVKIRPETALATLLPMSHCRSLSGSRWLTRPR